MFKKKFVPFAFLIGMCLSVFLIGCGTNETAEENIGETGRTSFDIVSNITDTNMSYNIDDLKKEVEAKGYAATKVDEIENTYFSVENTDYIINDEKFSVYQYNEEDRTKLEDDLRGVTEDGMMINTKTMNWNKSPHIYKKGRVVVLYDGDNETVLTEAKEILGSPILG